MQNIYSFHKLKRASVCHHSGFFYQGANGRKFQITGAMRKFLVNEFPSQHYFLCKKPFPRNVCTTKVCQAVGEILHLNKREISIWSSA